MTQRVKGESAARKNAANQLAGVAAFSNALNFNLAMARTALDTTFEAMRRYLQYAAQAQQAGAATVNDLSNVLTAAVDQAEYATSSPEFVGGCRALGEGQFMRAARNYCALLIRLSDFEKLLMQQAQAAAATRSMAFLQAFARNGNALALLHSGSKQGVLHEQSKSDRRTLKRNRGRVGKVAP